MRTKPFSNLVLLLALCMLMVNNVSGVIVEQSELESGISITGGRTILVEEITATWCQSCTEIDPYLEEVSQSHGSRIALIALHPNDGVDVFSSDASEARIDRLALSHDNYTGTPSFSVNGLNYQEGPQSWPTVQREILDEETKRSDYQEILVDIQETGNFIQLDIATNQITVDQQITVMLLAHQKQLPNGEFPGGDTRDRVLTDMVYLQTEDNQTYGERINITSSQHGDAYSVASLQIFVGEIEFWSIVTVVEFTDSHISAGGPAYSLGSLEITNKQFSSYSDSNLSTFVLISFFAFGFAYIFLKK
jgi:thiol-disulfide isomerase/thioredoxin